MAALFVYQYARAQKTLTQGEKDLSLTLIGMVLSLKVWESCGLIFTLFQAYWRNKVASNT